jgi:hypothetical protein
MPGMLGPGGAAGHALVTDFKWALLNQGTLALLIFVLLAITWVVCRETLPVAVKVRLAKERGSWPAEPAARRLVRVGFGVLWIFDGLLQAQPSMPGGLPSQVMAPAATGSPGWVEHLVGWAGRVWLAHPVQAAAATVWIQLGIGVWLVAAATGPWSRLAGLVSAGWGSVVWVFGEAFGSMLAPGQSWLTGAPGGVVFYCAAGILLTLPARCWHDPRLGRRVLRVSGALLAACAVLQAWPGRGFWQGRSGRQPGALTSTVQGMAAMRQPSWLGHTVSWFGSALAGHGFAVNLVVVIVLAVTGAALISGRRTVVWPAVAVAVLLCLATWVLVQDLGFLGGVGTDPNSMLPQALILVTGLLALGRATPSEVVRAEVIPGQAIPAKVSPAPVTSGRTAIAQANPVPQPARDLARPRGMAAARVATAGLATARLATAGLGTARLAAARLATARLAAARLAPARWLRPVRLARALGCANPSAVIVAWAAAILLLGTAPLAVAATTASSPAARSGTVTTGPRATASLTSGTRRSPQSACSAGRTRPVVGCPPGPQDRTAPGRLSQRPREVTPPGVLSAPIATIAPSQISKRA